MASENPPRRIGRGGDSGWLRSRAASIKTRLKDRNSRAITSALLAAAIVLIGLLVYWILLLRELPSTADLQRSRFEQATVVYSADGTELTTYQDKNREWVPLDRVSEWVPRALIATEDHRFYEHSGIDVKRTVGSAFQTLMGDVQGGSTITMQFARNAFPEIYNDWMFTRKIKEWLTALRIESMYTKEEILEMYLNTVPFMYNAFGIEAAAQTYFQVPASELNVKGAATLVGMLKGTVYYNPVRYPERAHDRRNVVLDQMVKQGYIEPDSYEELRDDSTRLNFQRVTRADEPAPHFAEYLRQWLDDWAEEYDANLYTDGLRVHTTIDSELQQAGQQAVDEIGARLQEVADENVSMSTYWSRNPESVDAMIRRTRRYRSLTSSGIDGGRALDSLRNDPAFVDSMQTHLRRVQAGFVVLDPRSGRVLAWVGGRDFGETQYDHVAMSRRQPGSTFKPFVYAAALESGFSPTTMMRDEERVYVDSNTGREWRPTNVGGATGRMLPLMDALAYSKNTITAQLVEQVGPERVAEYAHRMGIRSDLREVMSIGLGTSEVSLLELAGAYGTIANYGRHQRPIFVTRIEDAHGNVLARFRSESEQAISPIAAYSVLDMMRGVVEYGTGTRIRHTYGVRGDVAAKTGTSQNGADGWFMLIHPNLVMGAWIGFTTPAIHFQSTYYQQGAHTALPLVGHFYRRAREVDEELLDPEAVFRPPAGWVEPEPVRLPTFQDLYTANADSSEFRDDLDDRDTLDLSLPAGDEWEFEDDEYSAEPDEIEEELEGVEGVEVADSLNRMELRDAEGDEDPRPGW